MHACGEGCSYQTNRRQALVQHQLSCAVRRRATAARQTRRKGQQDPADPSQGLANPAPGVDQGADPGACEDDQGDVYGPNDADLEQVDGSSLHAHEAAGAANLGPAAAGSTPPTVTGAAGAGGVLGTQEGLHALGDLAQGQSAPAVTGAAAAETAAGLGYSSKRLAAWCQEANSGRGLPDSDVNTLLAMLREQEFSVADLGYRNAKQMHEFMDRLAVGTEFKEVDLSQPGDEQRVLLLLKDPVQVLQALLQHPSLEGGRIVSVARAQHVASADGQQGPRCYSQPTDCDLAVQLQLTLGEHIIVLLLQFYSDKTRLTKSASGRQAWPLVMTILNVSEHERQVLIDDGLVAYLPILMRPPGWSDERYYQRRLEILHACLRLVFAPFKGAAVKRQPLVLRDADGKEQFFIPVLASYAADQPETRDVAGLRHGVNCFQPCNACTVGNSDLWDPSCALHERTETDMRRVVADAEQLAAQGMSGAAEHMLQQHSIRSMVEPAIWGWSFSGNPYLALGGDAMHSDDIDGAFGRLVKLLPQWAEAQFGAARGEQMVALANHRLLDANHGCAGPFRIPTVEGGYIGTTATISAQEHRNAMQEMPMAVRGVFVAEDEERDDPVATAFVLWVEYYAAKHRRLCAPFHTDDTLADMETRWRRFMEHVVQHFGEFHSFNTTKCHAQRHAAACIRRLGLPVHYHTNFFEASHKATSKRPYAASNKKKSQAAAQMATSYKRTLAMRLVHSAILGTRQRGVQKRTYRTMQHAAEEGAGAVLAAGRQMVEVEAFTAAGTSALKADPTVQWIRRSVPEVMVLGKCLHSYFNSKHIKRIHVASTAKITAEMPWGPPASPSSSVVFQKLHASPLWHGQSVYDNVLVQVSDGGTMYAKLLLLFRANNVDLAYVRWYKKLASRDPVLRCTRVTWERTRQGAALCDVVPLASILRLVVLRPDHVLANIGNVHVDEDSVWHVSPWRWTGC